MPETLPQVNRGERATASPAITPAPVDRAIVRVSSKVRSTPPTANSTPSAFAARTGSRPNAMGAAQVQVQSGAVAPVLPSPGLKAIPAPFARLRANCAWIHASSMGNPHGVTRASATR